MAEVFNKAVEFKKRVRENILIAPWKHAMDVYGFNKEEAKIFCRQHKTKQRWR